MPHWKNKSISEIMNPNQEIRSHSWLKTFYTKLEAVITQVGRFHVDSRKKTKLEYSSRGATSQVGSKLK